MADFCKHCTENILGIDGELNDLKDLVPKGQYVKTLCEGCGEGIFDSEGQRVEFQQEELDFDNEEG